MSKQYPADNKDLGLTSDNDALYDDDVPVIYSVRSLIVDAKYNLQETLFRANNQISM